MDDIYRFYLLLGASRRGESLELEGVKFELKSDAIDLDKWTPTSVLGRPFPLEGNHPPICFPWFSDWQRRYLAPGFHLVEVFPGDRLTIGAVTSQLQEAPHGQLDHPAHLERKLASLRIERASGDVLELPDIWEFRSSSSALDAIERQDYSDVRRPLIARLEQALGLVDVEDLVLDGDTNAIKDAAEARGGVFRDAAYALLKAESDIDGGAAMAFGYLMGRAESEERVLPHAERRIELVEQLRSAAKKPRRTGAETRAVALEVIDEEPRVLLQVCAIRVIERMGRGEIRTVKSTIGLFFTKDADGKSRPDFRAIESYRAQSS